MRVLHIGDVVDAIEGADDNNQAYYLPLSGEIVWDQPEEGIKYIPLPGREERNDYHTMELFIEGLDDPEAQDWLDNAIRGKGAFRRFRGACEKFHILNDWYDFEYQSHVDLAIAWCEDHGIVYDMEMNEDTDQEEEEDVSDFYHDDYREEEKQPEAQETVRNPIHLIQITNDNMMNALYAIDGFRREVLKEESDLDEAEKMLRKAVTYGCEVTAASDQGRIVGILITEKTMEETIIRLLYVMKDMRGNGIGGMLMKHVCQQKDEIIASVPKSAGAFFTKLKFSDADIMTYGKKQF